MSILTFDIEEWYLYSTKLGQGSRESLSRLNGLLSKLLDDLDSYSIKATFFCLGAIARDYTHVIKLIHSKGHEIGCHSDKHNWLTEFTQKQFEEDTKLAINSIEQIIGEKVLSYRAPAFSIGEKNKWAFEVLSKYGIEYDCSIFPATRDFGGFPGFSKDIPSLIEFNGITMKEFPMGITTILGKQIAYSGGGYFRLLPYSIIKKTFLSREYNMTYFHIRDFDKEQQKQYNLRYFKNYYGINGAYDKFLKLLSDFEFTNISDANSMIDWSKVPVVKI